MAFAFYINSYISSNFSINSSFDLFLITILLITTLVLIVTLMKLIVLFLKRVNCYLYSVKSLMLLVMAIKIRYTILGGFAFMMAVCSKDISS